MRIAIHHRPNSFSDRWIEYCEREGIDYKLVNAYDSDIVEQVSDCDAFMWHHHQSIMADTLFARQLIYSLETKGIRCFPNFHTTWHFDDKVGQKYLLEAIGAPLVPSYVFYNKRDALDWVTKTDYPKVFKLRGGAGAANVRLVKNARIARQLVNKAFGRGFSQFNRIDYFKDRNSKWRNGLDSFTGVIKGLGRLFFPTEYARKHPREKGYVYFQDFIPDNSYDIRVCVVGDYAFALKRLNRKGDFRASGSGRIIYDRHQIDEGCVRKAFEINDRIRAQSIAFDFVLDENRNPLIIEISYGYALKAYDNCDGFWDKKMNWYPGHGFDFCGWMVKGLL